MWPHHDGSALHVSDLAPDVGGRVTVFLRAPTDVRGVVVRYTPDGEPAYVEAAMDTRPVGGAEPWRSAERWWRADLPVRNPVTSYRFLVTAGSGRQYWVNALGPAEHDVPDAYDFRLVAHDPPPAWAGDAVLYEIFPDRFARSAAAASRQPPDWAIPCTWETPVIGRGPETPRQWYGGDLDGITEHLDHVGSLGVNTVYLTPVFPARSNHRYDAASFDTIDPLLGGVDALARLTAGLRSRGMRLLGDITTNHCGDAHPWFTAALAGDAGERELFYFLDGADYESWLGVSTLPKLNWGSPEVRRRFTAGPDSVMARWLEYFDGWRVDVANMTGRCRADDHTHEVARLLRAAAVAARKDALVVAEHGHDFTGDLDRDGWQGTMNYAGFTRPVWSWLRAAELDLPDFLGAPGGVPERSGGQAVAAMRAFGGLVSWRSLTHSWTMLGSHDTARIRTIVGDAARVEVAVGLLMTYPGTPMVFAGDELGLTGSTGEGSRTPMPWRRRSTWDRRTLADYRRLIALRQDHPALRDGGLRWVYVGDDALAFLRENREETLLVFARRASGDPVALRGVPTAPGAARNSALAAGENLYGGADLSALDGTLLLPGDGPTFQVWRL
ncbi:MAG: glycoside hydrolase family 13 protein [Dactylosporangium sp.]|nr:glycoside hydrolase family 13 protein [Dactylosporangium sp.]NNJ60518.1 glycoside hydrolase family 13 protein [Dactylosporangium sp.]